MHCCEALGINTPISVLYYRIPKSFKDNMLQVSKKALLKKKLKKTVVSPATTPTPANIPTSMVFGGFDAKATPSCYKTQTRSIQTTPPTPRSKSNGASIRHDATQLEVTKFMGELKLPIVCRPFRRSSARLFVFACSWLLFLPLLPPRASTCGPDEDKNVSYVLLTNENFVVD